MATRRYGISRGEVSNQVTEAVGSATAADTIELTVDIDAVSKPTREDVLLALEKIKDHIFKGNWPPA